MHGQGLTETNMTTRPTTTITMVTDDENDCEYDDKTTNVVASDGNPDCSL